MIKSIFALNFMATVLLSNLAFANNTTLLCKSDDFNPAQNEGQALSLTFNEQNLLVSAHKVAGSWYCDNVDAKDLSVLVQAQGVVTYGVGFGCSEFNGLLTILNVPAKNIATATYEFSWDVDDYFRTTKSELNCIQQ